MGRICAVRVATVVPARFRIPRAAVARFGATPSWLAAPAAGPGLLVGACPASPGGRRALAAPVVDGIDGGALVETSAATVGIARGAGARCPLVMAVRPGNARPSVVPVGPGCPVRLGPAHLPILSTRLIVVDGRRVVRTGGMAADWQTPPTVPCRSIEHVFDCSHAMERSAGPRRRRGCRAHASRLAWSAPHRAASRVRGDGLPRGRGPIRAQPGARPVADAVRLDRQPVPRVLPRLRVLPGRAHQGAAGRRQRPAHRRASGRRCRHGHGTRPRAAGRPAVRAHDRARALEHPQARLHGAVGRRHQPRHQRRAPVPHRSRMAARQRRMVPRRPALPASFNV